MSVPRDKSPGNPGEPQTLETRKPPSRAPWMLLQGGRRKGRRRGGTRGVWGKQGGHGALRRRDLLFVLCLGALKERAYVGLALPHEALQKLRPVDNLPGKSWGSGAESGPGAPRAAGGGQVKGRGRPADGKDHKGGGRGKLRRITRGRAEGASGEGRRTRQRC